MVLENASVESDSFTEGAPTSDSDPYLDSNANTRARYSIEKGNLPKPAPILSPLLGYNDAFFAKVLDSKFKMASAALHRDLTNEEADAFAYWTAKQFSIISYGTPLGSAAGIWRWSATANSFRFPFYQPSPTWNPSAGFPAPNTLVRGPPAVYLWQALRLFGYSSFGAWVSKILFGGYSMSVATVGELSDKRLKGFQDAVRARAQQSRGSLPGGASQPGAAQRQPGITGRQMGTIDDASPTGGTFGHEDDASPFNGIYGDNRAQSDTETPSKGNAQLQGQQGRWPPVAGRPSPSQTRAAEPQAHPPDVYDDISPTVGHGSSAETAALQDSAWERLRRGEKPAPVTQKPSTTQPPLNQTSWLRKQNDSRRDQGFGDSFTFSKSEEEQAFAKSEAQKEFDAGVERERKGGDFSKGDSDRR